MTKSFASLLSGAAASALLFSGSAEAQVVIEGDRTVNVPSEGQASPWEIDGDLMIGRNGIGELNITNGGRVISTRGIIGAPSQGVSVGSVVVDGGSWSMTDDLWVGYIDPATALSGSGGLTISNWGGVTADAVTAMGLPGAVGKITIGGFDNDARLQGPGYVFAPNVHLRGNATLEFAHTWTAPRVLPDGTFGYYVFAPDISGDGTIQQRSGVTVLTGNSSAFTGNTSVSGGILRVDGVLGGDVSATITGGGALADKAVLVGNGEILGDVTIGSGGALRGILGEPSDDSLSMGNLTLAEGAVVEVTAMRFAGTPAFETPFVVNGDLVLDGTMDVGLLGDVAANPEIENDYRLFEYAGELTDRGLAVGAVPLGYAASDFTVDTATDNQVTLTVGKASNTFYWNGTGEGGDGIWRPADAEGWVNVVNPGAAYGNPTSLMVFNGTAGVVAIDADDTVSVALGGGLRFEADGYRIEGDALELSEASTAIMVGGGMTATIASGLTGAGGIDKSDGGTLILAGEGSYEGGTTITAGTLRGAAESFGTGAIANAGTLIIDQGSAADFANTIDGTGLFIKTGTGRLNLTGEGTFSGLTAVEAGMLAVNSDAALHGSAVSVMDGARIGGNGIVGSLAVNAGGIVAPGNSIGVLHVAGNFTAEPGWIFEVETDAEGHADRIEVGGTANIEGGTVNVIAGEGNYAPSTSYTILTADNVDGTFEGVSSNFAFLTPSLSYGADDVILTLTRNNIDFSSIGDTRNQRAVGAGVESLGFGVAIWDAVVQLDAGDAQAAFDQLSGEIHASTKSALIEDSRFVRDAAFDRLRTAAAEGGAVWGRAFGSWGHISGDGNAARLKRSTGGFVMGVDGQVSETFRLGVLGGYSSTDLDSGRGAADSDNYHLGAYAGGKWGGFGARLGVAHTWHSIDTKRSVAFAGITDSLDGDYKGDTTQVFGELGYRFATGAATLEPFANLAYVDLGVDGFAESGGDAALAVDDGDMDATFSTLGLRGEAGLGSENITASATVGWRHAFGGVTPLTTAALAGGDAFTVAGVPIARNAAVIDAGLGFAIGPNAALGVSYSGQFGDGVTDNGVRANFRFAF